MKKGQNAKRRGSTIVLVTTIGVIVGILALGMVQLGYHARMLSVRNVETISARAAADAGMVEAIFKMQKKLIYCHDNHVGWENPPDASGVTPDPDRPSPTFSYWITGDESSGWLIVSTGSCGQQSRTTHTRLDLGTYWEGIGVKESVDIKRSAVLGVVHGDEDEMVIRSNSAVPDDMKFKAFVTVPGDVICGPGGNPDDVIDVKDSTEIRGECYAASEPLEFPDVVPPTGLTPRGVMTSDTTISGGSYQYDEIDLGNGGILRITGPTTIYVTGRMILGNAAEVIIESGGSLNLYLGTSLEDKNGSGLGISNTTNDARNLKIYALPTCAEIDLKAKTDLYAAVYAPSADVTLYNAGAFTGAMVANSFTIDNDAKFYFDANLKTTTIDDAAAVFTVGRWWEN